MIEYKVEVYNDGAEFWRNSKGKLHREGDKPAIVALDGYKSYWKNGRLHRDNGPAVIYADGCVHYWLNGKILTKSEHEQRTKPVLQLTVAEIEAKYGCRVSIIKGDQ